MEENLIQSLVDETDPVPKRLTKLNFGLLQPSEMRRVSEFEVTHKDLYQMPERIPTIGGQLDKRLGISDKNSFCQTCEKKLQDCTGHFGYIKLELPTFHIGYFKHILTTLQAICKKCGTLCISMEEKAKFIKRLRSPKVVDGLARAKIIKSIIERAKKNGKCCLYCGSYNGTVKKIAPLKIIHEKYKGKNVDEAKLFHNEFETAISFNKDIKIHINKSQEDLNPLTVLHLFQKMTSLDCELLGYDPVNGRPELLINTHILVPPVCIRPSIAMEAAQGSNEDDITMGLSQILFMNEAIRTAMEKGGTPTMIMENWDFLQIQCALLINSEMPGLPRDITKGKSTRGFCQRLKGKTGRFRGNLSGKRVDFSSRTVISPDANLLIDEVAIPMHVAKILTYPEKVFKHNKAKLQQLIINGTDVWPGANYVQTTDGNKSFLKYGNRKAISAKLKIGDIVERHLEDGDIVLFNRQPSLHKLSIMAHRAVIKHWRTFRFNVCVCAPYNADFDGDEMNLHVPQTEEARAEALELMGVVNNLITPRNGEPLVAAIQDFISAAYLITRKDVFYPRGYFMQIAGYLSDAFGNVTIPPPAILKPIPLWTGKQIMNVLMRPNKKSNIKVNLNVQGRSYSRPQGDPCMCIADGYVTIQNSELLCGVLDKTTLGGGSKNNVFHVLTRDYTPAEAADRMSQLSKICARWIGDHGFSIGISDVQPSPDLMSKKQEIVLAAYSQCDEFIQNYKAGELKLQPGCTMEQSVEAVIMGELSAIRDRAGVLCLSELHPLNSPLIMAMSGSKGSTINICQMVACVGQQAVSGNRVPDGFVNRSLPHFEINAKEPAAKGFVKNSFYSGLTPTEFFFHTMAGREGLVDTAVKTAETGYMQRRLIKAMEDLSVQYDYTVRNASSGVVQFTYGDDSLDPAGMEGKERPMEFWRVLENIQNWFPCPKESSLSLEELREYSVEKVNGELFSSCSKMFREEIQKFFTDPKGVCDKLSGIIERWKNENKDVIPNLFRITKTQLNEFFKVCFAKYSKAQMEPGTAVGALGAQSIGEPATQMTLKTFHFAGVASMNITLGVPRIKEIINAAKVISTPVITASLVNCDQESSARIVKGRIEKTTLGEIAEYIKEVFTPTGCYLSVRLDMEAISNLQLDVDAFSVRESILKTKIKLKLKRELVSITKNKLRILPTDMTRQGMTYSLQFLKNNLPQVIVAGIPTTGTAVINDISTGSAKKFNLLVEGYGLQQVMATSGINGTQTTSNHLVEVEKVLGIEAARKTIMDQIQYTMGQHGMSIDIRHVTLLADLMTFKGEVLGITRFGIAKMKESVMMLASFEKTTDHLFEAAVNAKSDTIEGVSECIIMGVPIPLGTGLFKVHQKNDPIVLPNKRTPLL